MRKPTTRIVLPDIDRQAQAAKDLAKARALCKACDISFKGWVAENTSYTFPTALRLARIGAQSVPENRLTQVRAMNALANRRLRSRKRLSVAEAGMDWQFRAKFAFTNMKKEARRAFLEWLKGREDV